MAASALASGRSSAPPSPSLAQAQLAEHHHQQQQPVPSRTGISAAAATPGSRGGGGGVCAQEGESAPDRALERRMQAEALMARLERDGAPPGARCALCGGEEQARIPEERLGLGWRGATADGLGHMLFVRTSGEPGARGDLACAASM